MIRSLVRVAVLVPAFALSAPAAPPRDDSGHATRAVAERKAGHYPSDWFLKQRAWPQEDVSQTARLEAHAQARAHRSLARGAATGMWEPVGPTNLGGRVADVVTHPTDSAIVYIGTASGGVFRSTDSGATWVPLFDDESSLSIGSLAIDPNDPDVLWVGTGEPNGGGGSVTYGGTGVFRSTNAGVTWTSTGLEGTRYIGRVRVDPANPDRVFVAALGAMWSTGPDRGVYRTTDAGGSWQRVLASTDSTGAIDLVIDPSNPDRVYAAMWERRRLPDNLDYGGPTSGLFRSTDGGDSWSELTNGLPGGDRGRIGVALCESSPSVLYAIYAESNPGAFAGVFKSTDGGDSWTGTNDGALSGMYSSFGWWFGNIRVDPTDPERVFALGFEYWRSTNGGSSWSEVGASMHVDHHGQDFAPDGTIYEGNDGGMYRSVNGGTSWTKLNELPCNQFYTVEVDQLLPVRRYGGTQDNGTNRTLTGSDDDWSSILGGDGFQCRVDPFNNQFVYAEYQYGNLYRSSNGGASMSAFIGGGIGGRKNWNMPVELDPSDPATLYAGGHRLYRSTDRGTSWSVISPDLTDGAGGGNVTFHSLTTIAIAPTDPDVILTGSDDGNVHVTTNGGGSWTDVDATLPARWVTRVAFDPTDDAIGYVTISGFRWDEYQPHVFRTTDHGASWTDVSGDLPVAPVNDIVVDPQDTGTLYAGTDFGVYRSTDTGMSWHVLGTGLPNVVVPDIELHDPTRTLTAGTYGRSMWTFDLAAGVDAPEVADTGELHAPGLSPLRPNPAGRGGPVEIRWSLPRAASVALEVYDVAGRRVATLAAGPRGAGDHVTSWNLRDADGARVGAGVYLVRLAGDGAARTRKLTIVD